MQLLNHNTYLIIILRKLSNPILMYICKLNQFILNKLNITKFDVYNVCQFDNFNIVNVKK